MTETLVLVPGLLCTADLFGPQIAAFQGEREIVVADHRQDDTIPAIAARLLAAAPARFALCGLSMGGYVALEVLRRAPERICRLALLDTSARADGEEARERRVALMEQARGGRFEAVKEQLWERIVHPDRLGDDALKSRVFAMMDEVGPETFVRQQQAIMGRVDSRPLLPGVEIPTLVLVGEADMLTPPDLAREMAEAVEWASLVVVPRCGHLATLEQPDAVTDALRRWLST